MNQQAKKDGGLRWVEPSAVSESIARQKPASLLDRLLDEGVLQKELVMPDATYQVITRVSTEPGAWLFRSAVLEEGNEIRIEPFEPIFEDLTPRLGDAPRDEARAAVGRRALETHLSLYNRLAQQLQCSGGLAKVDVQEQWKKWGLIGLGVIALASIGVGAILWSARDQPQAIAEGSAAILDQSAALVDTAIVDTAIVDEVLEQGQEQAKALDKQLEPGGDSDSEEAEGVDTAPDAPANRTPPRPARRAPEPRTIVRVEPKTHETVRARAGEPMYGDPGIHFTKVPASLEDSTCITLSENHWDETQGLLLTLGRPTTLVIVHDAEIKKVPDWLGSYTRTDESLEGFEVETGRALRFNLYRRSQVTGAAALGRNTGAARWTKALSTGLRKKRFMYLACIPGGRA